MVLHADELRPAASFGQRIHLRHLIGVGIGDADVASFARAHGLVHAFQDFLGGRLVVPDVVDVEIYIIHAEVLQAAVYIIKHMLPSIYALQDFLVRARQELRGHHHVLASGHVAQGTAYKLFRGSQLIGYGRIEEVHAEFY